MLRGCHTGGSARAHVRSPLCAGRMQAEPPPWKARAPLRPPAAPPAARGAPKALVLEHGGVRGQDQQVGVALGLDLRQHGAPNRSGAGERKAVPRTSVFRGSGSVSAVSALDCGVRGPAHSLVQTRALEVRGDRHGSDLREVAVVEGEPVDGPALSQLAHGLRRHGPVGAARGRGRGGTCGGGGRSAQAHGGLAHLVYKPRMCRLCASD